MRFSDPSRDFIKENKMVNRVHCPGDYCDFYKKDLEKDLPYPHIKYIQKL
jgi:hypothetical protein